MLQCFSQNIWNLYKPQSQGTVSVTYLWHSTVWSVQCRAGHFLCVCVPINAHSRVSKRVIWFQLYLACCVDFIAVNEHKINDLYTRLPWHLMDFWCSHCVMLKFGSGPRGWAVGSLTGMLGSREGYWAQILRKIGRVFCFFTIEPTHKVNGIFISKLLKGFERVRKIFQGYVVSRLYSPISTKNCPSQSFVDHSLPSDRLTIQQ